MNSTHIFSWKALSSIIMLALLIPASANATGPRVTTSLFTTSDNEIHSIDFPPFITNEVIDGGAASEIIATAFRKAGIDSTLTIHPIKKIIHYYLEQENALSIVERHSHFSKTQQNKLIFVPVLAYTEQLFYYKPSHPQGLNLQTKQQKLTYGAHQDEDVSKYKKAGMNIITGRTTALMKKLKSGDIDFIAAPAETIQWLAQRYFKDVQENFIHLDTGSSTEVLHVIFNSQHQEGTTIAKKFKHALSTMRKDGTYQKIIMKHLGNDDAGALYLRRLETF